MRFLFLNYAYPGGFTDPTVWTNRIRPYLLVLEALARDSSVSYLGQIDYSGNYRQNGVDYYFIKPAGSSVFPDKLHKMAKQLKPDVVIVAGFLFPFQVMELRWKLGKKTKIILRHHADKPSGRLRQALQLFVDRYINAYLFSSYGNAAEWVKGRFMPADKVYELPASSTEFTSRNKIQSRHATGMGNGLNFLWVGRLNENKDPFTVLNAFEQYVEANPGSRLYMIYQDNTLLNNVSRKLEESTVLKHKVILVGQVPYDQLETWYSAADYFILASHSEGGNNALMEAMACGCVPITSNIPASMKAIGNGEAGYYFQPGDMTGLLQILMGLTREKQPDFSQIAVEYFNKHLSANAIAAGLRRIIGSLKSK